MWPPSVSVMSSSLGALSRVLNSRRFQDASEYEWGANPNRPQLATETDVGSGLVLCAEFAVSRFDSAREQRQDPAQSRDSSAPARVGAESLRAR